MMVFDGVTIHVLKKELEERLIGARVDKIYQVGATDIYLRFRDTSLFMSCNPSLPRVHLTSGRGENPATPPNFCILLRKYLANGRVVAVEQPEFERMIELHIESRDELGDKSVKRLILEMMGRHSNIILVGARGRILGAARHVDLSTSSKRVVMGGVEYKMPPSQGKKNPLDGAPAVGISASEFTGISGKTAAEIEELGISFEEYLARRIALGNISQEIERFYAEKGGREKREQIGGELIKFVQRHLKRAEKKAGRLKEELERARDREKYRVYGELLTANLHTCGGRMGDAPPEKRDEIILFNYYENADICISLDVRINAAQNAAAYYKKYAKLKTAEVELGRQIELNSGEREYLESVLEALERAETAADIAGIKEELDAEGFKFGGVSAKKKRAEKVVLEKHVSEDGFEVYVGRNNLQNDYLTLKFAHGRDLWFHVGGGVPGSHVVLRLGEKEASDAAIEFAARLAARRSKRRNDGKVAVDYCLVKNVKKPRGAKAGKVIYRGFKTVIVAPNP